MKSIHAAIVISVGLIVALWWAVLPPRFEPRPLPRVEASRQAQCPAGAALEGKQCVCPPGTSLKGAACGAN
jgi:hypothetical protein